MRYYQNPEKIKQNDILSYNAKNKRFSKIIMAIRTIISNEHNLLY